MNEIFQRIRGLYKNGNILTTMIFINVALFLLYNIPMAVLSLFRIDLANYLDLSLPAHYYAVLKAPWRILTYMFFHVNLLHLALNMLCLYVFGRLFLDIYSSKHFRGLYIVGGLFGGLFYVFSYNAFPLFEQFVYTSSMYGASSAIMAILMATAISKPNMRISLMFLNTIRLKYLAIIFLLFDLLYIASSNAGGHISHLGGMFVGCVFVYSINRGVDITKPINLFIDFVCSLFRLSIFRKKPKMKVRFNDGKGRSEDYEYNSKKSEEREEIGLILDKLKAKGYASLTNEEKKRLFDESKK